jgi:SET domain-containing protein
MKNTYRPLPKSVTIKKSDIEGLGLFATESIPAYTVLGITHVYDEGFENHYIRTPLGGFFNHSEEPNCQAYMEGRFIMLKTIKPIKKGDELTAKYWLYDVEP